MNITEPSLPASADGDYLCPRDRQSDRPTSDKDVPKCYLSVRVTMEHSRIDEVVDVVFKDEEWMILYPHIGKKTEKEHVHVFIPGGVGDTEKYRKRLKRHGFDGNRDYSVKSCKNGILQAIQYGSKEGTEPVLRGLHVHDWVASAPKWVEPKQRNMYEYVEREPKRIKFDPEGIKVTLHNFLRLAFEYSKVKNVRKENDEMEDDITVVMSRMFEDGYYPDPMAFKTGVPPFYRDVFRESVHKGKLTWTTPFVRREFSSMWFRMPRF